VDVDVEVSDLHGVCGLMLLGIVNDLGDPLQPLRTTGKLSHFNVGRSNKNNDSGCGENDKIGVVNV
jgi:hypothetical protein